MNAHIKKVTDYIQTHLDDELNVMHLAKVAGYSHFHFCRVFKAHMGESVMSYATRLRLERASKELCLADKSIIEVALDAGYQTPTGFLKAFKLRFDTTPTAYKSSATPLFKIYKDIEMNRPEIITRDRIDVIYTQERGEYTSSSQIAWKRLSDQIYGLKDKFAQRAPKVEINLVKGEAEALGICHDDPQATKEENIRYDAALAWGEKETQVLADYDFETKTVAGGRYAKVDYIGTSNSEKTWYGLYAWIGENGYTLRDEPAFEKYLNGDNETDIEKFEVEIYIPIE